MLAQLEYKKRHDTMGLRVYWELCKYGVKCSKKLFEECPERVKTSECGEFEIWWDRSVETFKRLDHNRPDIVVLDKKRSTGQLSIFCTLRPKRTCKGRGKSRAVYSSILRDTEDA